MNELFLFISRSRAFILFAILEIFALWCVYRFNNYGSAILFNTTSSLIAKSVKTQNSIIRYTKLNDINENLARENMRLNAQIAQLQNTISKDSSNLNLDSAFIGRYTLEYAEAINFTTNQRNNFITINKGSNDGIQPNMAVISATGVIGKVKMCSANMSLVTSILHSENLVSSKIKKTGKLGSVKWDGLNPREVELLYIDLYETIQKGDTIVTSDINSVFPGNIMVGRVKSVKKGQQFLNITLNLSTDFRNLSYVYVVKNSLKEEQNSLESTISNTKK
ncbi:MAG: rod shape-determining protein MreC [Bacteroidota bacterium]